MTTMATEQGQGHAGEGVKRDEAVFYPAGSVIFRQGDAGDSMFIIEQGRVRIVLTSEGDRNEVATLGAGDFFGELSLLSGAARAATAEALDDTRVLAVGRDVFAMMMQDDLAIVFRMLHSMGERLSRTDRQFWELMQRHGRIRVLAEGLRQVTAATLPVAVGLDRLATTLALDVSVVRAVVEDLIGRGAGALDDDQWRLAGPEDRDRLVELIAAYASGGAT